MARDGAVCVGDAWVDGGEIGNVPALANGVYAGRTIVEASRKSDFSANTLGAVRRFAGKEILRALTENKKMKLLATHLNDLEMKQLFLFMQHLDYPVLLFGKPLQRGLMLANFFLRNTFRLFQHPRIARTFFPKGGSIS
jgi:flavin-dependent dehydrogenase